MTKNLITPPTINTKDRTLWKAMAFGKYFSGQKRVLDFDKIRIIIEKESCPLEKYVDDIATAICEQEDKLREE